MTYNNNKQAAYIAEKEMPGATSTKILVAVIRVLGWILIVGACLTFIAFINDIDWDEISVLFAVMVIGIVCLYLSRILDMLLRIAESHFKRDNQ